MNRAAEILQIDLDLAVGRVRICLEIEERLADDLAETVRALTEPTISEGTLEQARALLNRHLIRRGGVPITTARLTTMSNAQLHEVLSQGRGDTETKRENYEAAEHELGLRCNSCPNCGDPDDK